MGSEVLYGIKSTWLIRN